MCSSRARLRGEVAAEAASTDGGLSTHYLNTYHCDSSMPRLHNSSRCGVSVRLFAQPTSLCPRSLDVTGMAAGYATGVTTRGAPEPRCVCGGGVDAGRAYSAKMNIRFGLLALAPAAAGATAESSVKMDAQARAVIIC